jgi:hypothetical protein
LSYSKKSKPPTLEKRHAAPFAQVSPNGVTEMELAEFAGVRGIGCVGRQKQKPGATNINIDALRSRGRGVGMGPFRMELSMFQRFSIYCSV